MVLFLYMDHYAFALYGPTYAVFQSFLFMRLHVRTHLTFLLLPFGGHHLHSSVPCIKVYTRLIFFLLLPNFWEMILHRAPHWEQSIPR